VKTDIGWKWFDDLLSFDVGYTASGSAQVGASAEGTYYLKGKCGGKSGGELGCVTVGNLDLTGTLAFQVHGHDYTVSDTVRVLDGWNNGKCSS